VKLSKNWGRRAGDHPKIWRAMTYPAPPSEAPLWRYHCSVTYVIRQWRSYHENFSFIVA